jgi:hypothetical protein
MNDSDPLLNSLKKSEEKRLFPSKKILTPEERKKMQEQLDESNKNKYFTSLPHIIEYHHNRSKKPENPNLNNAEENAEIDELFDKIDNNKDEEEEFDKIDNNKDEEEEFDKISQIYKYYELKKEYEEYIKKKTDNNEYEEEEFDKIDNNEEEDEIKEEFVVDNSTPPKKLYNFEVDRRIIKKKTAGKRKTKKSRKGGKRKTKKSRRKGRKRTKTYKKKKYLNLRKRN